MHSTAILSAFLLVLTTLGNASPSCRLRKYSARQQTFAHPGVLHTHEDLLRMRTNVASKLDPWYSTYQLFAEDSHSLLTYQMEGPLTWFERDHSGAVYGLNQIIQDGRAAINLALQYIITQNEAYAVASRNILDAWSETLKFVNGSDIQLGASLCGVNLVNATEILRWEWNGWAVGNITRFEGMIADIFYPAAGIQGINEYPWSGGWGTTGEKAIVAYGAFLSNSTMYQEGLCLYSNPSCGAACGNLGFMIENTGQYVESGRDQGHTQLSLGNMAEISQVALSQGDPSIYELLGERLRVGYEYTSEYQATNNTLPYNTTWVCCGCEDEGWTYVSSLDRTQIRPVREIVYGYYSGVKGVEMPYTKDVLSEGPETINPVNADNDNAEWGTLRFRRTSSL
ncbi:uncharacterized protein PAC_15486 [Phialocephala subalpina]|uniref:Alginate lyase domain-containing protein n=1 Tax=Phialocephala subalpina TaxID=576137 RepID=A0A1L7XKX7_9HELO|nr:uncharacterized protein PAC_15486 [Phialocephala subalpina]